MSRPLRLLSLVVTTVLIAGACSAAGATPGPSDPPSGSVPAGNLAGRTFLSTNIVGRDLVPGSTVRITFDVGRIGASAGCNMMGGDVAIVDGRLVVGMMAMTEMACAEPLMAQDTWLAAFLDGATISLDGNTLVLAKDAVTLTLLDREVADPDRPLVGTRWVVEGLINGDSVSSVPGGVVASLVFTDDAVAVESGCNSGGAPVEIAEATITFGPLTMTEMACGADAMNLERSVVAALAGSVAYTIEAGTLTLTRGGVGLILGAEG